MSSTSVISVLARHLCCGCAGGQGSRLTAEDCKAFGRLALSGKLVDQRFVAMASDFGLIARGQATPDVLLAYEL